MFDIRSDKVSCRCKP